MEQTRGHSIWLIPAQPELEYFQNLITKLSGQGDTSAFSPHITLLGQLPQPVEWINAKMDDYFKQMTPFQLSFSHVGMYEQYFRSIILHTHPNPDLEQLHRQALKQFEVNTNDMFVPHLSLLYSHLDLAKKKQLMEGIAIGSPLSMTISEVLLVETSGSPQQWQEITRIPLR